jgi:hypothetical protein
MLITSRSFSIMGQFIATVTLLEAAPTAFQNIGYKFWIILIILTAIYGILGYLYLPETKQKTLEDISVLFGDPVELSFEQALSKEQEATQSEHVEVSEHIERETGEVKEGRQGIMTGFSSGMIDVS